MHREVQKGRGWGEVGKYAGSFAQGFVLPCLILIEMHKLINHPKTIMVSESHNDCDFSHLAVLSSEEWGGATETLTCALLQWNSPDVVG